MKDKNTKPKPLSDSELDAVWRTINLEDSQEEGELSLESEPLKPPSRVDRIKMFIEEYVPGGRLILYSILSPIAHANIDAANCWVEQLNTFLPTKPTLPFLDLVKPAPKTLSAYENSVATLPSGEEKATSEVTSTLKP
tara:strand:+ start:71013 stop:71426 length:414 start_codon:yes stop_codon:yes gene_type:complete